MSIRTSRRRYCSCLAHPVSDSLVHVQFACKATQSRAFSLSDPSTRASCRAEMLIGASCA